MDLHITTLYQIYLGKIHMFILIVEIQDYHLLINLLLGIAIIMMIFLLAIMTKSLRSLKESALEDKEKGKFWISNKLYDFDAEQLKILLKKININKADKNDKQVETKN